MGLSRFFPPPSESIVYLSVKVDIRPYYDSRWDGLTHSVALPIPYER